MILSPLTGGTTTHLYDIPTEKITSLYRRYTDVSLFFTQLSVVSLHQCNDTGYRFYYPYSVAGNGHFYEDLANEELYYIPWKDEHAIADAYIKHGDTVLEQGCANGDFLLREKETKQIIPFGTELNETAQKEAAANGVHFTPTTTADVVCSFQVLEHIADVRSFIMEAITAAKPGATIIFGVPNNDSFIAGDPTGFLNMPPHHMGLWTTAVFKTLPKFFPVTFVATHTEILQPQHYRYYYQRRFGDKLRSLGIIGKIINKALYVVIAQHLIKAQASRITGHTLMAIFKKA